MKSRILLSTIFFIFVMQLFATPQERSFDDDKLDNYKKMEKYDYDQEIQEEPSWLGNISRAIFKFFGTIIGSTLGYIIIIVIALLLVYLLLQSSPGGFFYSKKPKQPTILAEETEDIQKIDLDALLNKALSDKNYRFAIRYLYLIILKKLDDTGRIVWVKDKTNREYLYEINNVELRHQLAKLTTIFEYAWYGEITVEEQHFLAAKPSFDAFQKLLVKTSPS